MIFPIALWCIAILAFIIFTIIEIVCAIKYDRYTQILNKQNELIKEQNKQLKDLLNEITGGNK